MIEVNNLTLKYRNGKGIFNVTFNVNKGEVVGFLGPNGAGKTTTIRNLLGFMKADEGYSSILGYDTFKDPVAIQHNIGYVPGEIAFLEHLTGHEFLSFMSEMRGLKNKEKQKELIQRFELDLRGPINRYSKGMKQKLGIIVAFMHNPEIIILDEPTSGLDPLMQQRFVDLILEEKAKGKTILMSSHIFEEVERTCDRILIIKNGKLVSETTTLNLKNTQKKTYILQLQNIDNCIPILQRKYPVEIHFDTVEVQVTNEQLQDFLSLITSFTILSIDVKHQSLEELFMDYYKGEQQ